MDLKAESIKVNSTAKLTFHPLTKELYHSLSRAYLIGEQQDYVEKMIGYFRNLQTYTPNIGIVSVARNNTSAYQIITGCFTPLFDLETLDRDKCLMVRYKSDRASGKERLNKQQLEEKIVDLIYSDFISHLSMLSLKRVGLLTDDLRKLSQNYPSKIWQDFADKNSASIASQKFVSELTAMSRDALLKQKMI